MSDFAQTFSLDYLHRALGGEISRGKHGSQVVCPGPGHSEKDRSLAVAPANNPDRFVVHSFSGDDPIVCKDYVRNRIGSPPFRPSNGKERARRTVAATYDYTDEGGQLLFQAVRFEPKGFAQRRPDGLGDWIWNLEGVRRVPYRLPELIEALASERPVFIVEGEKDCEALWSIGLPATCNPQGAGKWRDEYSAHFRDATVYVLPDNDKPGLDHAEQVKASLERTGATVSVVQLPRLPERGDVSDWLKAGGTAEQLYTLAQRSTNDNQSARDDINLAASFTFLGDTPAAAPRELIKGLIPAEGIVVTGGQSSAGKTFVQIHKAICLATAIPYFGHKIIERVGTALVAAEGRSLLPNRFAAALAKLSVTERLPITWLKQLPDFSSPEGVKLLIKQLKALDERYRGDFGIRLGNAVIDTVAACFGMKDEDDNSEATKVCGVMRQIGEEVGTLMGPVHHYGKNAESGLRGASAWKGSTDVIEGVLADIDPLSGRASNRELVCAKARDGEQGPISAFDLEFIRLGLDADGDVYGSCCVVPTERDSRFDKGSAPSKSQRAILEAISEALDTSGKLIVPRTGMPEVRAAKVSDVRLEFDRRYVVDADDKAKAGDAKRKAFKRALDFLSPAKFGAGSADGSDWIWRVQ